MRRAVALMSLVGVLASFPAAPSAADNLTNREIGHEETERSPEASQPAGSEAGLPTGSAAPPSPRDVGIGGACVGGSAANGGSCWPEAAPGGVDLDGLVLRARAELTIRFPGIETSPPHGNPAWVQLPVWLWLPESSWHEVSATASDGDLSVTVTARPTRVRWDMGNGDDVVCDGPGTPYDYRLTEDAQSSDCSYTYTGTSKDQPGEQFTVTASMEWSASYVATNGARGSFEPIEVVGTTEITVGQVQALTGD